MKKERGIAITNKSQTAPCNIDGVVVSSCSSQWHILTANMGNGRCSECGIIMEEKHLYPHLFNEDGTRKPKINYNLWQKLKLWFT